ncbi:MAG: LLM class flavin-dependent oxidoreductase [Streptosporangiales bacterium]|nr:LLM class flavin-dependent oxidoreductase [Streptosporangiales bacterium]
MRFGIFLLAPRFPGQDEGEVLDGAVAVARAAERYGFDDVWLAEHHFMAYGICPSALTFASYLLGNTARIGVGTAVTVLSGRHPVDVAEQTALLDRLSGGRLRLGVGRGGPWLELEVFGTGLERYETGFTESLDLLLAALERDRVRGDGPAFRFREVPMVPRPATRPRPPVVVACTSEATRTVAAERGLPMLLGMHETDAQRAAAVAHYAAEAARHGRPPHPGHVAAAVAHVADEPGRARAELLEALPRWLGPGLAGYVAVDDRPRAPRDPAAYAAHLCDTHPVGTPAECADRMIATVRATGVRHFILMVEGIGDPERAVDTVRRLGEDVLPEVRSAAGEKR